MSGSPDEKPEPTPEEQIQAVYNYAAQLMTSGLSDEQVKARLVEDGFDEETAGVIVTNLAQHRREAHRSAGKRNLLIGGASLAIGLVITIGSMAAAGDGGRSVIAYGAVLVGIVEIVMGLYQLSTAG